MASTAFAVTIVPAAGSVVNDGAISYEAFDAGAAVYRRADNTWAKARSNVVATARFDGIAVSTSEGAGQRVSVLELGTFTTTGLTQGQALYVSPTVAGQVCLESDLTTGNYVVLVGVSKSTTVFSVNPFVVGTTKP